MGKKEDRHLGRSLDEFTADQRAKDRDFRAEFDRLQLAREERGRRKKEKNSR